LIISDISGVKKNNIKTQLFAAERRSRVSQNGPAILFSFVSQREKAMIQGKQKPTRNSHWEKAMIQGNKDPVSHKERWGFLC